MSKVQVMSWDYERLGTGFRFFIFQNLEEADLKDAFEMQISARVFGAQIGHADIEPVKNQNITVDPDVPVPGIPPIMGRLDDWQAYDTNGKAVNFSDPTAKIARVRVTGLAIVKGALKVDVGSHVFEFDILRNGTPTEHPVVSAMMAGIG